jgi:hypothetical protein
MMNALKSQPSLFGLDQPIDAAQADVARIRMRNMIARLGAASNPPWRDEMAVILDDGAFQRAMYFVPHQEAQALWAEFNTHVERLYTIWAADKVAPPS